ncbi:MAG TPA: hypothetical protein VMC08_01270 [Bacteroidales bacterium]|nr:hypothetical protein [Bacteroidales bacterium]
METYEKILVLNNQFEAERLEEILADKEIPYAVIPIPDSPLGGITSLEKGWGYVEAPGRYRADILDIYKQVAGNSDESGDSGNS